MRNGRVYARPTSAPRTSAPAGFWLLPTPRTSDTNGTGTHGTGGLDLRTAVTLLPTPTARDGKGSDLPSRTGGRSLPTVLAGDATPPLSPDGSTSPGEQLLIPLSPDEPDAPAWRPASSNG